LYEEGQKMKKKFILISIALLLVVMAACQSSDGSAEVPEPTVADPVITEVPEPTVAVENVVMPTEEPVETIVPTETPVPTESPVQESEMEPTVAPTAVPEPTATPIATPTPTVIPEPTATPTPTATPVPQDVACTYNFKDMKYFFSYGMTYDIKADGSMDTTFDKQYQEIMLKLPKSVDMEYCSKIVVKAKSEEAPVSIKFYGKERFDEDVPDALFTHWRCKGNGIVEYEIAPIADGDVAGIGIMAIDDYNNLHATIYSITFYVKADYAEKLMAKPTPTPTPTPEPTKALSRAPMTGMTAEEIVDKIVIGWNLGNTLECISDLVDYNSTPAEVATIWSNEEPTQEVFESVKAAGFNAVRIPVTWAEQTKYDTATDTYVIKPEWMDYVKKTVDYAYYLDLFVIINTHHEEWLEVPEFTDATYATAAKIMEDIWEQVAEAFKDYDQGLIFEGMNEPREKGAPDEWDGGDAFTWEYLNKLNEVFVRTVRSHGSAANKERLLMITGQGAIANNEATLRAVEVPKNAGNIAISIHAYVPYEFTMAGGNPQNSKFPGTNEWGQDYETMLDNLFASLKQIAKEKDVPFIMGEFGASDNSNPEDRARWATYYLNLAKDAGIPCFIWDNQGNASFPEGDRHGLIHRKSGKWFENAVPMLQAAMKVYGQPCNLPKYVEPKRTGFSWNNILIEKDWVELYRSESGEKLAAWGNVGIKNWKKYFNGEYKIVVVYDSAVKPTLTLQGGWYNVTSSGYSDSAYMLPFSMKDVEFTLQTEKIKLEDMLALYVSAGNEPLTVYGVYAVPVK